MLFLYSSQYRFICNGVEYPYPLFLDSLRRDYPTYASEVQVDLGTMAPRMMIGKDLTITALFGVQPYTIETAHSGQPSHSSQPAAGESPSPSLPAASPQPTQPNHPPPKSEAPPIHATSSATSSTTSSATSSTTSGVATDTTKSSKPVSPASAAMPEPEWQTIPATPPSLTNVDLSAQSFAAACANASAWATGQSPMHPHTLAILWFLVIYAAWLGVAEETVAELITDPTKRVKGDVFEPLVNAAHGLIESDKKAQEKSVNTLELPISIKTLETPKQQQVTKAETAEEQVKGAITQISEFLKDD